MNLCANDCGFTENHYQQVLDKNETNPDRTRKTPSQNNNNSSRKSNPNSGNRKSKYTGKIKALDVIWMELKNAQMTTAEHAETERISASGDKSTSNIVSCLPISRDTSSSFNKGNGFRIDCNQIGPIQKKSQQRMISLKNLFSNTPKFQKNFQRGVFLSCLIYSEDKILVTMDELLPSLQIDEDTCCTFQHDFHWLHKISTIWNDSVFLKQEIEKCDSASTLHFRLKMLQTIVTMQDMLDLKDLGKVYYQPITTDNTNVTFICTVAHLRTTKLVAVPCVKWISAEKFKERKFISDNYAKLFDRLQSIMLYHAASNIPLGNGGLYLGYFKLVTSVDLLKVIVAEKMPSIVPHVKVRNNPQVTREELELFHKMKTKNQNEAIYKLSESQLLFRQQIESAVKKLFSNLKVDRKTILNHRFYTTELIEVSSSISLVIVLPTPENSCPLEGDLKDLKWMEQNKLIALPIQVFEMIHFLTYHNTLARRMIRVSSTLEVETVLAQHNRRKAFSTDELSTAQKQLSTLASLQSKLETTWKDCRWILEMVKAARAKDTHFLTLREFLSRSQSQHSPSSPHNKAIPTKESCKSNLSTSHTTPSKKHSKVEPSSHNQMSQNPLQKILKRSDCNSEELLKLFPIINSQSPQKIELSGSSLPLNPNFKFESSSSLPIVGKVPARNNLRTTASLFDMKTGSTPILPSSNNSSTADVHLNLQSSLEAFIKFNLQGEDEPFHHYQNITEIRQNPQEYQNNLTMIMPMKNELDSYMKHTSSRSKLVSLSTIAKPKTFGENIPGTSDPIGLKALSWTKQRTSLDRCISNSTLSSSDSCGGRKELLLQDEDNGKRLDFPLVSNAKGKVVEIYAAFECGLSTGIAVRLQIAWDTSARQIIQLLLIKLNDEMKGQAGGTLMEDFYLVSVIGARERVLRMDYRPLRLQKPWDTARLFVRRRHDVTAAVALESKISGRLNDDEIINF